MASPSVLIYLLLLFSCAASSIESHKIIRRDLINKLVESTLIPDENNNVKSTSSQQKVKQEVSENSMGIYELKTYDASVANTVGRQQVQNLNDILSSLQDTPEQSCYFNVKANLKKHCTLQPGATQIEGIGEKQVAIALDWLSCVDPTSKPTVEQCSINQAESLTCAMQKFKSADIKGWAVLFNHLGPMCNFIKAEDEPYLSWGDRQFRRMANFGKVFEAKQQISDYFIQLGKDSLFVRIIFCQLFYLKHWQSSFEYTRLVIPAFFIYFGRFLILSVV